MKRLRPALLAREKFELACIAAAGCAAAALSPLLPVALTAGNFALLAASLLLGQGLVRDLWLEYGAREAAGASSCSSASFCAESGLGLLGVAVGGVLLAGGAGGALALTPLRWALFLWATGALGFALKDVVIDLRARRIRVEKDHRSVVLW